MKKYKVYAKITGFKFIGEYDANDESQAIEVADEDATINLCKLCSKDFDLEIEKLEAELK